MDKDVVEGRNIAAEIIIVIFGTCLVLLGFIGVNLDFIELTEIEDELIRESCKNVDDYGNNINEKIECISNRCYLKRENEIIETNCNGDKASFITEEQYNKIKENFNNTESLCNHIDENGLYLDQYNNYCMDGICKLTSDNREYSVECPSVVPLDDEELIDDDIKKSLTTFCENYNNGEVVKDNELARCEYNSCKISNETKGISYALRCDSKRYRVFDKTQDLDDDTINEKLDLACSIKQPNYESVEEGIRCFDSLCSFHYKENDYFKRCDK